MILWAIQHAPSGGFLPNPRGRGGRGGTHVEPTTAEPPRLFTAEQYAKSALTYWLAGCINVIYHEDYFGEVDEHWTQTPVPGRRAEDMRIVAIRLEVQA